MIRHTHFLRSGLLVALAGLALGSSTHAQQVFSTYIGPDNGAWHNAFNWDTTSIPNGPGSVALVPGPRIVSLNAGAVVDKYGVGGVIRVQSGVLLGVYTQTDNTGVTGIFGGGTTSLESTGAGTYLRLYGNPGSFAIHGNSGNPTFIQMSNSTANIIDGSSSGILFINEGTIRGSGQIGANALDLNNTGSIIAQYAGGALYIDPGAGGLTNSGVLMSQGGSLVLQNGVFTNTGTGSVNIQGGTGGTVTITGARIVGGTLQGTAIPGEAFYCISNSVLQDVRIAGEARVPNGHLLYLDHGLEVAAGALYLDSTGSATYLRTLSDTTLFGVMSVELSNSTANIIDAQTSGHTLTNNLPGGIRGSGQLGANSLNIVNNTYVYASGSSGLIIDPAGSTPFINHGHVVTLTGSSLLIQNGIFDNAGAGWIDVQPNAVCVFSGVTVLSGNLNSAQPNGYFSAQSDSLLDSVTITPSAIIQTPNGHITYLSGAIDNRGTYILNSTGSGTWLRSSGNYSISGGGTISCSDSLNNIFDAQVPGQVLTLQNQTLRGSCQLGANSLAVVNNGLIEAQGGSGILIDAPGSIPFDNNTTLRVLTGSQITVTASTFDNTGGLFEVQDGAVASLVGSDVRYGTFRTLGGGIIYTHSNSQIADLTLDIGSRMAVPNGHLSYVTGTTLTNRGTFQMGSTGSGTWLRINAPNVTFTGGGTISCSDSLNNIFDAQATGNVLTLQNQTLRGSCQLGANSLAVVNNGLIEAQGGSGILIDSPGSTPFDNNTTLRVLTGSQITVTASTFDNTGGLFEVQDGAVASLVGSDVRYGTFRTLGGGIIYTHSNSQIADLTLDIGSRMAVPNGHLSYVTGTTLTNRGTFQMGSTGSGTWLRINAPNVTFTGGGTISCTDSLNNIFDAQATGNVLTFQNQTLRGACQLGANSLAVVNNGSIIADASNTLLIDPPNAAGGFTNGAPGLLHALGPGSIYIQPGPFTTAGTVLVNPGRTITRNSDTWVQTGGLVMCDGLINVINSVYLLEGGYLSGTGVVRSPTTNSGGVVSPGASPGVLTIEGTYTQTAGGSLLIEVGGPIAGSGYDRLVVTSTASLSGTLTAYRIDGYEPNIGDTFDVLTATAVTGTFSNIQAPEFSVTYLPSAVRLTYTGPFCDPDYTQDGNADQDDVAYLVNAISGGGNPNGSDLDFNRDGNSDQDDVLALVNLIAGGGCP